MKETSDQERSIDTVSIDRKTLAKIADSYALRAGFLLSDSVNDVGFTLTRLVGFDGADPVYFTFFDGLTLETVIAICDGAQTETWTSLDNFLLKLREEGRFPTEDDYQNEPSPEQSADTYVETDLRYLHGAQGDYLNDPGYRRFLNNFEQEIVDTAIADFCQRFPNASPLPTSGMIVGEGEHLCLVLHAGKGLLARYCFSINQTDRPGCFDLHFVSDDRAEFEPDEAHAATLVPGKGGYLAAPVKGRGTKCTNRKKKRKK
jgi:hypothetical protein